MSADGQRSGEQVGYPVAGCGRLQWCRGIRLDKWESDGWLLAISTREAVTAARHTWYFGVPSTMS